MFIKYLTTTVTEMNSPTPPVISNCPRSSTYTIPVGISTISITWTEPTASDNSGVALTMFQSHRPGDIFEVGTTEVLYVFTDPSGSVAMCAFDVTGKLACHYSNCWCMQASFPGKC